MPYTDLSDGCIAAERLRAAINSSVIVLPTGDALPPISVSLGVSMARSGDTTDSLFARADKALRQAIEHGGNCVKWQDLDQAGGAVQEPAAENEALQVKPFMSLWPENQSGET